MSNRQSISTFASSINLKTGIWLVSIGVWMFGILERAGTILAHGQLTGLDLAQEVMMVIALLSLFILKPKMPDLAAKA